VSAFSSQLPVNGTSAPLVLAILDGVGARQAAEDNAVWLARAPFLHTLLNSTGQLPGVVRRELRAHGPAVGLTSESDMGNSEVGHNIMGAGRIFDQGARQVEQALREGTIWGEPWHAVVARGGSHAVHFIGLLSDGNVHSHIDHLEALIRRAAAEGVARIFVHVLFDGRDVPDFSGQRYLAHLQTILDDVHATHGCSATVASGGGRMNVTMDRYGADWRIVERGWRAHVHGSARGFRSAQEALDTLRAETPGVSDQFLPEFTVVDADGAPLGPVADGDAVVLFNFRGDRMVEIYQALADTDFTHFDRGRVPADPLVVGMALYDGDLKIPALFLVPPTRVTNTVSEVLARGGHRQAAIAETQKFGHVTYFWNGNRSDKFDDDLEDYTEIPSDRVPFEQRPWMKSAETADAILDALHTGRYDFIRANFAAGDMVGHTGDLTASIVAIEGLDISLRRVAEGVTAAGGTFVITADHGNCEVMFETDRLGATLVDDHGHPVAKKSHTLSPVPFIVIDHLARRLTLADLPTAGLANVAATVLTLLGVPVPADYEPSVVDVAPAMA
jgi:2,3-bisphosphoglycerate-independent phosphoglycerate mutase